MVRVKCQKWPELAGTDGLYGQLYGSKVVSNSMVYCAFWIWKEMRRCWLRGREGAMLSVCHFLFFLSFFPSFTTLNPLLWFISFLNFSSIRRRGGFGLIYSRQFNFKTLFSFISLVMDRLFFFQFLFHSYS